MKIGDIGCVGIILISLFCLTTGIYNFLTIGIETVFVALMCIGRIKNV